MHPGTLYSRMRKLRFSNLSKKTAFQPKVVITTFLGGRTGRIGQPVFINKILWQRILFDKSWFFWLDGVGYKHCKVAPIFLFRGFLRSQSIGFRDV